MLYQIALPPLLLIPILMTTKGNHASTNQSDVIVTYSNHAEADSKPKDTYFSKDIEKNTDIQIIIPEKFITEKIKAENEETRDSNEVVFVPNERQIARNEEYLIKNPVRIEDYMARKTVNDVMDNRQVRVETEPPADIIFLTGKNNENENTKERKRKEKHELHADTRKSGTKTEFPVRKLRCSNLNCNNTVESICGGKIEHKTWKYRLFLNECFYRKVNCNFKHEVNRYIEVPLDKCQYVGAHATSRPSFYQLFPEEPLYRQPDRPKPIKVNANNTRRSFPSRRSLTMSVDGQACSHVCPATCPDDYQPECAVSSTGVRRVFINHCKLDYNSCTFRVVWHKRPLSECVGGKKADMRQNRGFIDWMQRVGIVDNKGRLVLS